MQTIVLFSLFKFIKLNKFGFVQDFKLFWSEFESFLIDFVLSKVLKHGFEINELILQEHD